MALDLQIGTEFSSRKAASQLHAKLVEFLASGKAAVGTPFLTDYDLVERSGLSRSTVRRALDQLQKEGWLDRRIGVGSFVGPRAAMPGKLGAAHNAAITGALRLAVLIFNIGDLPHDWYTPHILEGLDKGAETAGIVIELLGNRDRDINAISRRLERSRPDILACLAAEEVQALVIRDAQRLDIPCILSGTPHLQLGLPAVCEDNRQGMTLAVKHLLDKGHRRIGLLLQRRVEPWVFLRHEAFSDAMRAAGLDGSDTHVFWTPLQTDAATLANRPNDPLIDQVEQFITSRKLTAIIVASNAPMTAINRLQQAGRIHIPRDLSVVMFEQNVSRGEWLNTAHPSYVRLPLKEMGERIASAALRLRRGEKFGTPELLPCTMIPGDTVRAVSART